MPLASSVYIIFIERMPFERPAGSMQSMAADMSKMSCGGGAGGLLLGGLDGRSGSGRLSGDSSSGRGAAPDGGSLSDEGPGSPMATDRRTSGSSACSPQAGSLLNKNCANAAF